MLWTFTFGRLVCLLSSPSQAKEKYEKSLEELSKCTQPYMDSMEQVFDQCQQHEVKRLTFLKEALLDIKRHLNLTENQRSVEPPSDGLIHFSHSCLLGIVGM